MKEIESGAAFTEAEWPKPQYAWYVVCVLSFAYLVSYVDRQILNLLVELIRADLNITDTQISLLQGLAFGVFYAVLGLPIGVLVDRGKRVRIILGGVALWTMMTAACGLARGYGQLFAARVGVGVGEAALSPAAYSLIADYLPPQKQARAMAIYFLGAIIGIAMAMLAGAALIQWAEGIGSLQFSFIGEIRPWQLTFLVASIPGVIAFLLMLSVREPVRRLASGRASEASTPSISEVVNYVRLRKASYGTIIIGFTLLSLTSYGYMSWVPTYLIRFFNISTVNAGLLVGVIYLIAGLVGTLGGGWLSDFLFQRGYKDAPLRVAILAAIGVSIFGVVATMMSDIVWTVVFLCIALTFLIMPYGLAAVALQTITPNQMRGQINAFYLLVLNLVALGLGPLLVALLTDYLFKDPMALGKSLSLVTLIVAPSAVFVLRLGLRYYRPGT